MKHTIPIILILSSILCFAARGEDTDASLLEEVVEMRLQLQRMADMVAFIEQKCETDPSWRKAYHGRVIAQKVLTNEFGIAYKVEVHNDGFTYASFESDKAARQDPENEAKQQEIIRQKAEDARAAMEKATLPPEVAARLQLRREALKPKTENVIINAN